jgi:tetratricopeptide (TPR) repeat protein
MNVSIVLLPGAEPEKLPRLLLPFGVVDIRGAGLSSAAAEQIRKAIEKPPAERLPVCPWPGLKSFEGDDATVYFGREGTVRELVNAVRTSAVTALLGPRFSGRMSAVRAGLIPELLKGPQALFDEVVFAANSRPPEGARRVLYVLAAGGPTSSASELFSLARAITATVSFGNKLLVVAETEEQVAGLELATVRMPALSANDLRRAVTEPARVAGLALEPALADRIASDLAGTGNSLPKLQFCMQELWARRSNGLLSAESYADVGGPAAIGLWCERILGGMTSADGEVVSILTRLIVVGEDRRAFPRAQSAKIFTDRETEILEPLISAGLLVRQQGVVEFAHPLFVEEWPRLMKVVANDFAFLSWRRSVEPALSLWRSGRRSQALLRGEALAAAKRWSNERRQQLSKDELEFISESASVDETDRRVQSASRVASKRRNIATYALLGLAVIIAGTASYSGLRQNLTYQEYLERANNLAQDGNFEQAVQAYEQAINTRDTAEASKQLAAAYEQSGALDKAVRAYTDVLRAEPRDRDALRRRGQLYSQLGDTGAARADLAQVAPEAVSRLEQKKPGQVTVFLYDRGFAREENVRKIEDVLTSSGFLVERRSWGIQRPPNAMWYSSDLPEKTVAQIQHLVSDAGVELRQVNPASIGTMNVQIGYSARAAARPRLDLPAQVQPAEVTGNPEDGGNVCSKYALCGYDRK